MNYYGYDSFRKYYGLPSYPYMAGLSASLRRDLREIANIKNLVKNEEFMHADLGRRKSVEALGGKVGMQLDHAFANGVNSISAELEKVSFTDHKAIVTKLEL